MRRFLSRRNIIIVVVLVLVAGWWYYNNQAKSKAKNGEKMAEVVRRDVVEGLTISGEIKADKSASLTFPAAGKVAYVGVKDGEEVKKGQVLAYLDLGDLQASETKAYYAYLAADANAKYVEDLVKDHDKDESFTQKNSRVTAQTTRDSAFDTWLTAQRAVRNAKLVSPFTGIVTAVTMTTVGDTVSVADGITVVDPTSLYFGGEVDETDVGKIMVGQRVKVELDAFEGQEFEGEVQKLGFSAKTSATGATVFEVWVKLGEDILPKLRLGMNGDAQIVLATATKVLTLPVEAVVDGEVIIPGKEGKKVEVETGLMGDRDVEIKSGINEGDRVIIK